MPKRATKTASKSPAKAARAVARASSDRALAVRSKPRSRALAPDEDARFTEAVALIEAARSRAYQAVNVELVSLYWQLGEHISRKIASAEWGDGVVDELAAALARRYPGLRGYTRRNLFRMRQLYEAYRGHERVSPLVTQLPWTHHLIILSQAARNTRVLRPRCARAALDQARARAADPVGRGSARRNLLEESIRRARSSPPQRPR